MKRIFLLLLALLTVICSVPVCASDDNDFDVSSMWDDVFENRDVSVYVNGNEPSFDVPAQIIDGRTMVPVRAIFEAIGATVTWDDVTRTAISTKGDITVKITIGQYSINKNGADIAIDVPAQIVDSRTLVPVRAIAESFDCLVEWYEDTRTVRVKSFTLDAPASVEKDNTVVFALEDYNVSQAFFDTVKSVMVLNSDGKDVSNEQVLEQIKLYAAVEKLAGQRGVAVTPIEQDALDYSVCLLHESGQYEFLLEQLVATDMSVRKVIYMNKLISKLQEDVYFSIDYSEAAFFEHLENNYVRVKHILVATEEEALALSQRLSAGEQFEALCAQFSLDGMDVNLGYVFTYGKMVKEFEDTAFALAVGETSAPVKTSFGYHIVKRYDIMELGTDYLITNYGATLALDIYQKTLKQLLEGAMSSAGITVYREDLIGLSQ